MLVLKNPVAKKLLQGCDETICNWWSVQKVVIITISTRIQLFCCTRISSQRCNQRYSLPSTNM